MLQAAFVRVPDPRDRRADAQPGSRCSEAGHWLQSAVYTCHAGFCRLGAPDGRPCRHSALPLGCEYITTASLTGMDLGQRFGVSITAMPSRPDIFYKILGEQTGLAIVDEASLLPCVVSLARAKRAYDKIKSALDQVEATGYGIVMPGIDELTLEEPEIVQAGRAVRRAAVGQRPQPAHHAGQHPHRAFAHGGQ